MNATCTVELFSSAITACFLSSFSLVCRHQKFWNTWMKSYRTVCDAKVCTGWTQYNKHSYCLVQCFAILLQKKEKNNSLRLILVSYFIALHLKAKELSYHVIEYQRGHCIEMWLIANESVVSNECIIAIEGRLKACAPIKIRSQLVQGESGWTYHVGHLGSSSRSLPVYCVWWLCVQVLPEVAVLSFQWNLMSRWKGWGGAHLCSQSMIKQKKWCEQKSKCMFLSAVSQCHYFIPLFFFSLQGFWFAKQFPLCRPQP